MATYTITELAREFGITARAIRFYEDQGLLEPTRHGTARIYDQRDRTRLKLTLRGKRLGLQLSEVKALLDMYESPADTAPQLNRFLNVLGRHRKQLEQQLADIGETLAEIAIHETRACQLLQMVRRNESIESSERYTDGPLPRTGTGRRGALE
jgi:DNA-binding transcriptional MerR regulator